MAARAIVPLVIHNGNCTERNAIWRDFKIGRAARTKISRQEFQLPLYYSHFEIAEFSQYQYFIDLVTSLLKNGNNKAFTSHFVFEKEMMRYRAKMLRFKTEMT